MMKKIKMTVIIMLMIAACMMTSCFPKAYTVKEEKDQLARAIAIARDYQEKYAAPARLKENTFRVYDAMPEDEQKLYLTDWVTGEYLDGGEYSMYINTESKEVYSDKGWTAVQAYGQSLVGQLYGLEEKEMIVTVWGYTKLPFRRDDASFGMVTLSNMLPAADRIDESYVSDILEADSYHFTYHIGVGEGVAIDQFKKRDFTLLGKNVSLRVRRYSDAAFANTKAHPGGTGIDDREGLLDEYISDEDSTAEDVAMEAGSNDGYDGTWYAQDESGAVLIINKGKIRFMLDEIDDQGVFEPVSEADHIRLSVERKEDKLFWFYEINYYAEDERIVAYTWPEDDGDGGYKRTVFKRTLYEPADTPVVISL